MWQTTYSLKLRKCVYYSLIIGQHVNLSWLPGAYPAVPSPPSEPSVWQFPPESSWSQTSSLQLHESSLDRSGTRNFPFLLEIDNKIITESSPYPYFTHTFVCFPMFQHSSKWNNCTWGKLSIFPQTMTFNLLVIFVLHDSVERKKQVMVFSFELL